MSKHTKSKYLFVLFTCLFAGIAYAGNVISEFEPNNPVAEPQHLVAPSGTTVQAYLGNNGPDDIDYYMFYANAGDVVDLNIDNGYYGGTESVDLMMYIFDGVTHKRITWNDDETPSNPDPRIPDFSPDTSGYFIVAVTNYPRFLTADSSGNIVVSYPTNYHHGDYVLKISGATPNVKQVAIRINPGSDYISPMPINPRSRGKIPVAVMGGPDFNVSSIDTKSLTFGSNGYEASLSKCNPQPVDLNGDGRMDLICHFDNQAANFKLTDAVGKLRGETTDGIQFEGNGDLKVTPLKGHVH